MELSSLFLAGKGSALTSFFSTAFLVVFLPFCLVVYSLMPRRGKKYFLLAADCAFFWLISGKLLVYLLLTALSMHYFGLWLDKIQSETKLLLAQTEKAERKTVRKPAAGRAALDPFAGRHSAHRRPVRAQIFRLCRDECQHTPGAPAHSCAAGDPEVCDADRYLLFHAAGAVLYRGRAARRHKSGHESAAPDAVHQLLPADRGRADLPATTRPRSSSGTQSQSPTRT